MRSIHTLSARWVKLVETSPNSNGFIYLIQYAMKYDYRGSLLIMSLQPYYKPINSHTKSGLNTKSSKAILLQLVVFRIIGGT
jgi:hypothetical protein